MIRQVLLVTALWLFILNSAAHFSLANEMNKTVSPLTQEQKKRLIEIAKATIRLYIEEGKVYQIKDNDPRLSEEEGTFVTIHKNGELRGCIGNILGRGPLYLLVRDMAIAAATEDSRFPAVRKEELKDLQLEISVLSKPWVVQTTDEIQMGTHGVIISRGVFNQGVFLPQVATETGWSKEEFLSELCSQKAGLPRNCYKDPATTMRVFTANVFSEKDVQ